MTALFLFIFTFFSVTDAHAFGAKSVYLHPTEAKKLFDPAASFSAFDKVARITIKLADESDGQCAGLLLKDGYLLTARHCIESLLSPIQGYDEALPRAEFLQRVRAFEETNSLRFSITIFSAGQEKSVYARLASIGEGLRVVMTPNGIKPRRVQGNEVISGSDADWALLDIGQELNSNCVPLSLNNYRSPDQKIFVIGAPLGNARDGSITGNELRVSAGQSVDPETGIQLLIQDDILDGAKPGPSFGLMFSKTGFATAPVLPGYSGGAFLDAKGGYLGVTSFMLSHFQGSGYAPIAEIQQQWSEDKLTLPHGSVADFFCAN